MKKCKISPKQTAVLQKIAGTKNVAWFSATTNFEPLVKGIDEASFDHLAESGLIKTDMISYREKGWNAYKITAVLTPKGTQCLKPIRASGQTKLSF